MALKTLVAVALLAAVACGPSVERDWTWAKEQGTEHAFQEFLKRHPESPRALEAKKELEVLVEERDWGAALREPNRAGFRSFLERYPDGRHSEEAGLRA